MVRNGVISRGAKSSQSNLFPGLATQNAGRERTASFSDAV